MSGGQQGDAQQMFWSNPDLMEKLLPFLDAQSTLCLVQSEFSCTLDILQDQENPSIWIKLARRVVPFSYGEQMGSERLADLEERLAEVMTEVNHLVGILKMMDNKLIPLLDLLDIICERFPPVDSVERENLRAQFQGTGVVMVNTLPGPQFFQVHCSRRDISCKVSPFGFLILEQVQKKLGATELLIEQVVFDLMTNPWLSALASWLLRQRDLGVGVRAVVLHVECYSTACAEALSTVMEQCESFHIQHNLCIDEDVGTQGWTALRKGLALQEVNFIVCDREDMASARREDLKAIWASLSQGWTWLRGPDFSKDGYNWPLLEQYLDMTEEEWAKLFPSSDEDSSSSGEEDE